MLDSTLPRQRLQLNIFEMRYRALVQRAMSAGRRFGMVGWRREGSHAEFGTEVEIVECEPTRSCHPLTAAIHIENATAAVADEEWPCRRSDGRYMIEVVGRRRFRLLPGTQTQAGPGYMVSELEFCSLPPPVASAPAMYAADGQNSYTRHAVRTRNTPRGTQAS